MWKTISAAMVGALVCAEVPALAQVPSLACRSTGAPSVAVPATDEVTILDPRTNSLGKPQPVPFVTPTGETRLDIPATIVVHNFYYSGDRDFRGPVMPGGPCIVVANHPRSGERVYVDVQLLPGSPRISYRANSIEYDYGHQRVLLRFGVPLTLGHCDVPTVTYTRSNGKALEPAQKEQRHLVQWLDRTGAPHVAKSVTDGGKALLDSSATGIHRAGEFVVAPVVRIVNATPLGGVLTPNPSGTATELRDRAVQRATSGVDLSQESIPTIR